MSLHILNLWASAVTIAQMEIFGNAQSVGYNGAVDRPGDANYGGLRLR
jgi:hypothetical protein